MTYKLARLGCLSISRSYTLSLEIMVFLSLFVSLFCPSLLSCKLFGVHKLTSHHWLDVEHSQCIIFTASFSQPVTYTLSTSFILSKEILILPFSFISLFVFSYSFCCALASLSSYISIDLDILVYSIDPFDDNEVMT